MQIVGVLLAAGAGTRFGGDKLTYRLPDGRPIAVAAAANLQPACDRMVAVLRSDNDELAALLTRVGCEIVRCPEAAGGMGHSLAAGVQATADANGWIVTLADMPFISSGSHQAVGSCLRGGASLAASRYRERRGHPVGFCQEWLSELVCMKGDYGGKAILDKHRQNLVLCPVDDPGVLWDIDKKEDLEANPGLRRKL